MRTDGWRMCTCAYPQAAAEIVALELAPAHARHIGRASLFTLKLRVPLHDARELLASSPWICYVNVRGWGGCCTIQCAQAAGCF